MVKGGVNVKQAAAELGVTPKWIRARIAEEAISPKREGGRRNGRFILTKADVETLRARVESARTAAAPDPAAAALARIDELEADRANLLAQVAWARAIAQEQQKTLEIERARAEALVADLETQRARVEALKALSLIDRAFGRHKAI